MGAATEKGMKATFSENKCQIYQNDQLVLTGERTEKTMYYSNLTSRACANLALLTISFETARKD